MSNVFQLFEQQKNEDDPSNPDAGVTIAIAAILASSAHLGRRIKELSRHFDALDRIIDAIGDTETRNMQKQSMKLNRETLANATLELSRQIRKLPRLQIRTTLEKIG
jgi:hypothetical protein